MDRRNRKEQLFVAVFWSPSKQQTGYRGQALAVSSENKLGKFDILPQHTNFITMIFKHLSIITPSKKKIDYQFDRGVLEVSENLVRVFLGI